MCVFIGSCVLFLKPRQQTWLQQMSLLCHRMTISSPILRLSLAGPNQSQAGRRPPSTAFTEATETLRSPKSPPRLAKADTLCSAVRTREGTSCHPNSWSGFWCRELRRRGLQGSSVTSTTSTLLATQSLSWISDPAPKGQIQIKFSFRPVQIDMLPKSLSASAMVKSSSLSMFHRPGRCFDVT